MINPTQPNYLNTPASPLRSRLNYQPADPAAAPVVSIVTPFFNGGAIFDETVKSVFAQTLQQWEWIIVNDGSTQPEALAILNEFRRKDARIRVVDHAKNLGLSAARNTGFAQARAEFVFPLDADDLIEPTALEKMAWHLLSYPEFAFANGFSVGFGSKEYLWRHGFQAGSQFLEENMVTATCLVRKAVQQAVGGYESENRGGMEDWDFWLKCAAHGHWGNTIPEFFDWYRRRETGREHWENLLQSDKTEKFRAGMRRRYAKLWEGKFPKLNIGRAPYASSVGAEIPFANALTKQNPRLLLIVPHFELGGADKFNLDLIHSLQTERGYEVTVVGTRNSRNEWQHEFEKLTPDVFALNNFLYCGDFPLFLRYLAKSRQPDAICVSNSLFGYEILPYLRAHFPGLPIVDYLHMEEDDAMGGGYPRHSLRQHTQLARTGVTSQHLKNWVVQRGGDERAIDVCPMHIDCDKWRRESFDSVALAVKWKVDSSKPVILYAARICEQKQPAVFAEVIRQVAKKNPSFTALVAGDGPDLPWLKDFVKREQLKQVRFLGPVSNDEVRELLALANIFFLPSQWEGIALGIYEAMAMSVVTVGAVVGGQAELVTPGCGVLVSRGPNEVTDYTEAILKLLAGPAERAHMAQAARKRILDHYPIVELGKRMDAIFAKAKAAAIAQSGENLLPLNLAALHAGAIVEETRAAAYADQLHQERSELMPFVTHSLAWQACLRAGRALAAISHNKPALAQFEEGLRCAIASGAPSVVLTAHLEIGKAAIRIDPARARAILENGLKLEICSRDAASRAQITKTLATLQTIRRSPAPAEAPLVSVVIPCYNYARLLPEAVESVLRQTFQDFEIIIVNDGSTDNTVEVAQQLIRQDGGRHRMKLVTQANSGQPAAARNAGIKAATGEFILPLDADDKIAPAFLEKTVAILRGNAEIGIAFTHIQHFGDLNSVYQCGPFDPAVLARDNVMPYCSLYRRSLWEKVGGYKLMGYEDWDFWLTLAEEGCRAQNVPEPLFCYRKHGQGMLNQDNQKRARLMAEMVSNHPKLYAAKAERKSLRITYLVSSILGVTGGNQTLLRQAEEMQRRGHDVTIVTYTPKPDWFQFKTRVIQAPSGQPLAASVPPSDVVVATYFTNAPELKAITAPVKIYYAQGDQFVFGDSTMADTPENRQWREMSRASYGLPGIRFVPNSRNLADAVQKLAGRKADAILPVCTDQTIFHPLQRSLPGSKFRVLIVGPDARGTETEPLSFKGIQDIHDGLQILARKHLHFTAVRMSGCGPDIFTRFPCEFYIAPDDATKTALFGTAHILVYASHYDSCPRPPQEAMAAGCAVVCTATAGAMEYCRDGENALLVPINSPEAIAKAVERLIVDHGLREKLVQGGLATAREYPREREWNEWENILYRFMDEAVRPAKAPRQAVSIKLPPCALLGHLGHAGELLKKKNLRAAKDAVNAALQARPFHPEAFILLGKIEQAAGNLAGARAAGQEAANFVPNWKPAKQFLKGLPRGKDTVAAPGKPARLTVCLIAKNEEQFLAQCLQSVRDIAHQIIVVDTGSTDRTVEIARQFNAEIYSFAWTDDFSAARNEALQHATGDWILSLDADEELLPEHLETLLKEMQSDGVMGYRLPIIDKGLEREGCSYVPRLFRNAPGLFFLGRVHEQIFSSLEVRAREWGLENRLGHAALLHHGYTSEVVASRGKNARNLRLLELAITELPDEPNLIMNLGLETIRSGNLDAGLGHYREALRLMAALPPAQVVPELRESLLTQLTTHLLGAKRFGEILELWHQPFPQSISMTASQHFMLGLAHMELQQPAPAVEQMRQCLAKRNQPALSPVNKEILKAGPRHCLALSLAALGKMDEAAQTFHEAIVEDPQSRTVRFDFAKFQFQQGHPLDALKLANELVAENPQDIPVWQLGGQIALSQPDFLAFAQDWTGEAFKNAGQDSVVTLQRAEALLLNQQAELALPLWIHAHSPTSARHLAALALCEILTGEFGRRFASGTEKLVSQEFLKWYRQLINHSAHSAIHQINENRERLSAILPTAADALGAAMKQAEEAMAT